ncbi:hypothetical protein QWY77_11790 [Thalassotalea ponticola]|uniref:hypothetical protein n=1 Tax=Thalassotalea ponticola TaxID=1523392 RepID=UPI0025B30E84|nr:hypothetical protein [Thalassotalea ponticola]MDN3653424.1 hypothetical protein [Thalassotalea ponticola]
MSKNTMSKAAAARIQSATAKANGGVVPKDSFAARAMSSASKSGGTPPNGPSKTGNPSGGGRGNNPPKSK